MLVSFSSLFFWGETGTLREYHRVQFSPSLLSLLLPNRASLSLKADSFALDRERKLPVHGGMGVVF